MERIIFKYEGASAELRIYDDGRPAMIGNVYSNLLGRGHAKNVMEQFVKYADEHDLTVCLVVQSFRHPDHRNALTNGALVSFYSKFGFRPVPGHEVPMKMIREGSQGLHSV